MNTVKIYYFLVFRFPILIFPSPFHSLIIFGTGLEVLTVMMILNSLILYNTFHIVNAFFTCSMHLSLNVSPRSLPLIILTICKL
jgi:hypothetical protein